MRSGTATDPAANELAAAFCRFAMQDGAAFYLRETDITSSLELVARSRDWLVPQTMPGIPPRIPDTAASFSVPPSVTIPLRYSGEESGTLLMTGPVPTEEMLGMLEGAGGYVAALLENSRLETEVREGDFQLKYRLWELESLYDIGLSIASTLNLDDLAEQILLRTVSLLNARRAALYLHQGDRFAIRRSFGEVRSQFLDEALDATLAQRLVKEGSTISAETGADCIFPGCGSFVALPILGNSQVIGVLAAADREQRDGSVGTFSENEIRLLSLFANQVSIALENARLHSEALEKQAMERELELAATIQSLILPRFLPQLEGFEVAAFSRPAKQLGGDYHTFFERNGDLSICVADVAGKSVPAAILVSALHAALQLLMAEGRDLGDIATELNRHIHLWSAQNKFITLVLATIDRTGETVRYVNAGHNPAYIRSPRGLVTVSSNGLPIGIMASSQYRTQSRPFPTGSTLTVYSDGITEAENLGDEEFGNERLEDLLLEATDTSCESLSTRIAEAVTTFVGDAPQKDDQTIVVVRTR